MKINPIKTALVWAEKLTHWLQINYDRDNFWLARKWIFWVFLLVGTVYLSMVLIIEGGTAVTVILYALIVMFGAVLVRRGESGTVDRAERQAYSALSRGLRNPLEIEVEKSIVTFSMLVLTVVGVLWLLTEGIAVYYVIAIGVIYNVFHIFLAVTPLHPNAVIKR